MEENSNEHHQRDQEKGRTSTDFHITHRVNGHAT